MIKHTHFINCGENGKNTNGRIVFDIEISVFNMNGFKERKIEIRLVN